MCPICGAAVPAALRTYVLSGAIYPCTSCGEPLILKDAPVLRPGTGLSDLDGYDLNDPKRAMLEHGPLWG